MPKKFSSKASNGGDVGGGGGAILSSPQANISTNRIDTKSSGHYKNRQQMPAQVMKLDPPMGHLQMIGATKSNGSGSTKKMKKLKCIFVGDDAVGKTSLIVSYTTNGYPTEYVPTAFDTYSVLVTIDNKPCQLQLCDTAGQDEFDSIRPLCYNHADVFLVSFSVVSPQSFNNIRQKWLPEIRRTISSTVNSKSSGFSSMPPFILIGTQCDLRHDVKVLIELDTIGQQPISYDYAKSMAKKLGAICYIECSALTQKNLKEVFDSAILAGLEYQKNQSRHQHKNECKQHHGHNHNHHLHSQHNTSNNYQRQHNHKDSFQTSKCIETLKASESKLLSKCCSAAAVTTNAIYQDYSHRHFLPSTPSKGAQISDAKLVSWRKSLTKLSAQEALKSEATSTKDVDEDDNENEDDDNCNNNQVIIINGCEFYQPKKQQLQRKTKLSTFLPSPIITPKLSNKSSAINNHKKPTKTNHGQKDKKSQQKFSTNKESKLHKSLPFSDPEDDQGFHDETPDSSIDYTIDCQTQSQNINNIECNSTTINNAHKQNCQFQSTRSTKCKEKNVKCNREMKKNSSPLQINKIGLNSSTSYTSSSLNCSQVIMLARNQPYDYCLKQLYNNPYGSVTTYQTPYDNAVAPIYQTRCPPPTPISSNSRIIYQLENCSKTKTSKNYFLPEISNNNYDNKTKTNLATTLRSSSFFFLPSNTLKMMKQQRKQKSKTKKSSKCNSSASTVSCSSSVSSASSGHSSNELFRNNNESHRKSMLDMFHQMMSTSVTELRNRKCSMFKRLASSLSSTSSSHNTSSTISFSKEKQRLKSGKLKDLYYYDSYDYEEIDLDGRNKCCFTGKNGIWSCCFPRSF